jgi:hypothetical protein
MWQTIVLVTNRRSSDQNESIARRTPRQKMSAKEGPTPCFSPTGDRGRVERNHIARKHLKKIGDLETCECPS